MILEILPLLLIGLLSVFLLMFVVWIISLRIKNAGLVDVFWGAGIVLLTGIYTVLLPGAVIRKIIVLMMVSFWGLRLSGSILVRLLRENREDKRYQTMRESWKSNLPLKFLLFFEFQAFLQVVLSIPFLLICRNGHPALFPVEIVGIFIWLTAFVGEVVADEQLRQFKTDPQNKGKTCQSGLWYYSRHPNYFFEWLTWVGYFIFALASPYGWLAVISPSIMLYLLLKVSGVPLAEAQSLKSRGDEYRAYQRTTSVFVPLPKRR